MAVDSGRAADNAIALMDAVAAVQTTDPSLIPAYRKAMLQAMFQGFWNEVVANSELVPVTTDTGTAGAGIITGKVK